MTNPKMKSLTIGGVTYDTVGEASVTQVVGSGTKIATVTIDGTSTDLYAPSGSTIDPATATPLADGTAAVGSSAKYAREDHVHPTDTSRAASDHEHGNITNSGGITATAPTIASGDKLVINDASTATITNGPSFGSSTTTFLANNGTWQTPAGTYSLPTASTSTLGGVKVDGSSITISNGVISAAGGVSMSTTTCTLGTSGWSNDTYTASATGVTSSNNVIVAPAPTSAEAYGAAGIVCTAQGANSLTFTRTSENTSSITVNVLILR